MILRLVLSSLVPFLESVDFPIVDLFLLLFWKYFSNAFHSIY
jgi:hypothetical protein